MNRLAGSDDPFAGKQTVLVVMGVAGCGKSTIAKLLAADLGWPMQEGDDLHPQANVDKMHAGHPLDDADRAPWLENIARWVEHTLDAGENGIVTCSALKRSYREVLNRRGAGVVFVYLAGSREAIAHRLSARRGHYMPASLLDSQFATLEKPGADEPVITVDKAATPEMMIKQVSEALGNQRRHTAT